MIWWIAGTVLALGVGAVVAVVLHRREKATRLPHAYDRSMWSGT